MLNLVPLFSCCELPTNFRTLLFLYSSGYLRLPVLCHTASNGEVRYDFGGIIVHGEILESNSGHCRVIG